jgi:hypothetical protein
MCNAYPTLKLLLQKKLLLLKTLGFFPIVKNWQDGCKWDIMSHTYPLGDYLLGVYFKIFLEYFEQKA